MAWVGRHQEQLVVEFQATLSLPEHDGEVGLTTFLNAKHHYEIGVERKADKKYLFFRRQIGSLVKMEAYQEIHAEQIKFSLSGTPDEYRFAYLVEKGELVLLGKGETSYLTTEVAGVFTGIFLGFFATKFTDFEEEIQVSDISYRTENPSSLSKQT